MEERENGARQQATRRRNSRLGTRSPAELPCRVSGLVQFPYSSVDEERSFFHLLSPIRDDFKAPALGPAYTVGL